MGQGNRDWIGGITRRTTFVDERGWSAWSAFKTGIVGRKGESAVALELRRLGLPCLHDAILADLFGVTQIDHVVCGRSGIYVLETKTLGGHITGALEGREWVQSFSDGQRQRAFQNPVRQNFRHCRAVEAVVAGYALPVRGYVVSAGAATFGGALGSVIVPLARLGHVVGWEGEIVMPSVLAGAWARLVSAAERGEGRRDEHAEMMRRGS